MFSKLKDYFTPYRASGPVEFVIAGLGNPGDKYENTRHNIGFMAVDRLCQKHGVSMTKLKYKSLCGDVMLGGRRVLLLKPSTYMNLSGEAVRDALAFYKLGPEQLCVISDDVALPLASIRIRQKGSDGGQKGLKNIIYLLGTDAFTRVRIGIGPKPHPDYNMADFVLSRFTQDDLVQLDPTLDRVVQACELIAAGDTTRAISRYNKTIKPPAEDEA